MGTSATGNLAADIAAAFEVVGFEPKSAVIYGSVAAGTADGDSDIDVLCVVDELPSADLAANLDDLIDYRFGSRANLSLVLMGDAELEAADPGSVVTWAIERGVPVTGAALGHLFPGATAHDEVEAAQRAHARSAQRVAQLRSQDLSNVPRSGLSEQLLKAANAALLHHGLGRFKTAGARLGKSSMKLASLVGHERAWRVSELCRAFEHDIGRAAADEVAEVSDLVDVMLESASDPGAPGATAL